MVCPGMNQVLLMRYFFSSAISRGMPTRGPYSPREIHDGDVWPRAMKPEIASKSKVKQTMWRRFIVPPHPNPLPVHGERGFTSGDTYLPLRSGEGWGEGITCRTIMSCFS